MKNKVEVKSKITLPDGVVESDLKYPDFKSKDKLAHIKVGSEEWAYETAQFELWYTESMGWVIPTLLISRAGRRAPVGTTDRVYATTLDGKPCRVGRGPHVLRTVTVYVRESRLPALQKYLDIRNAGSVTSNEIRDRISSRRAQGQLMRQQGRTSWRWDI